MINLKELQRLTSIIPVDIGGGSSIDKISVMAGLADYLDLQTFIELGVYRGRSFLPMAYFLSRRNGYSYGVDPYTMMDARENDLPEALADSVNRFFVETDYEALYRDILRRRIEFRLENTSQIIRQTSQRAAKYFSDLKTSVDMIHIDGNHDTKFVMQDVELYIPLLNSGGVLILDDIDWSSVKPALVYAKERLTLLHLAETYAVLINGQLDDLRKKELQERCVTLEKEALILVEGSDDARIKVSVSMITYNQESYIAQAIESALNQTTDFEYEIVIGEDNSTDRTRSICQEYQSRYPEKIRLLERTTNVGAVRNYLDTYEACRGEYVAFLEGDDFWIDVQKLQKQVDFLDKNLDYAICFHNVYVTDKNGTLGAPLLEGIEDTTTVYDLCTGDFISTPSCMIRNRQIKKIPDWIYGLAGCDWPFDILNAECGKIKCLPGLMAAYRRHDASMWTSLDLRQQYNVAINLATDLDRYLDFRYKKEFQGYIFTNLFTLSNLTPPNLTSKSDRPAWRKAISTGLRHVKRPLKRARLWIKAKWKALWTRSRSFELVIVDDAYPHPQSAFRLEEYDVYLEYFEHSIVYATGRALTFFNEDRPLTKVITAHEGHNLQVKGKIAVHDQTNPVRGRLAYTIFAGNAWDNVEYFERNRLPFVFTLYPGGSFYMNDAASDERLRRIFGSPMFRRVIVTQKITREYLLQHAFCSASEIDFIYGVVTPRIHFNTSEVEHSHFYFDKDTLDICFTAHKYTPDGHDKGYDIFLEVAKILATRFPECRFHVVGGFAADDLPINGLESKITFYGGRTQEWLSEFYRDKDLLLSCNVPFVIRQGAFDGFPTGSATDAMLNKLALFCTDPLALNQEFMDGRDLVIVPHDVDAIVDKISWYRNNPAALRDLALHGCNVAGRIYSFDNQMAPRIEIIRKEMTRKTR